MEGLTCKASGHDGRCLVIVAIRPHFVYSRKSPPMPLLPLRAFCLPQHWTQRTYSCLACCGREVTMDNDAPFSPSHLSITTSYRHSLRRFLPVFAGAPMSYNP